MCLGVCSSEPSSHCAVSASPMFFMCFLRPHYPVWRQMIVVCFWCSSLLMWSCCGQWPCCTVIIFFFNLEIRVSMRNLFSCFQGVTKNFQRVTPNAINLRAFWRQNSKLLKAWHAGCGLSHDLTVLHFTGEEWSSNQNTERAVSCNLCDFSFAHTFSMLDSLWCTDQSFDVLYL